MTGYESKRAAARDKLVDDRRAYYEKFDDLYAVYLNGVYDGKKAAAQEPWRESASDYERGVIDGRQMQAQSSVDKAVNAITQRPWVGLTKEAIAEFANWLDNREEEVGWVPPSEIVAYIDAKLKGENT
jgi:hypothetical protein